jgi:hypothetical protein
MEPVPIPWDRADGFFGAYWRRPEAYPDDHVRRGISVWARVGPEAEQPAVHSLRDDLVSGRWAYGAADHTPHSYDAYSQLRQHAVTRRLGPRRVCATDQGGNPDDGSCRCAP